MYHEKNIFYHHLYQQKCKTEQIIWGFLTSLWRKQDLRSLID